MRLAVLGHSEKARGWIDMTDGGCGTNSRIRRQAVDCQRRVAGHGSQHESCGVGMSARLRNGDG